MQLIQKDLPTNRLSFTQVDAYLNCPRKYEWRYIIKPEMVGGSPAMAIGHQLHELIANVLIAKKDSKKINVKTMVNASRDKLDKSIKRILSELNATVPQSEIDIFLDQHDKLFAKWKQDILPELAPTAVEQEINTTIGGYPFIMYLDVIHKNKKVIDWKVTASPKNKYTIANSLQLSVYSIGAELDEVAFGSLVRPKKGKEKTWKPSVQMISGIRTKADRDWATQVVKSAAKGIQARYFPVCSPENFLCDERYCDFYPLCRGREDREPPKWMSAFI